MYEPDILILLETQSSSRLADRIMNKTKFMNYMLAEADGYAGEIWIFWSVSTVWLEEISIDDHVIMQ